MQLANCLAVWPPERHRLQSSIGLQGLSTRIAPRTRRQSRSSYEKQPDAKVVIHTSPGQSESGALGPEVVRIFGSAEGAIHSQWNFEDEEDHEGSSQGGPYVTSVPTCSPITTRFKLWGPNRSKTMIGILLSMQSEKAVASMTLSCFCRASMYLI